MRTSGRFLLCALVAAGTNCSLLVAQVKEATATATAVRTPAVSIPKMGPLTVTVEMLGGQKITGTLTEITELPIRSSFGEVKVPLSQVAGVKLASADDPSTTIILKNGDSVTGATDLQSVSVDTEWGSAKINGSSITSLLLLPDYKWTSASGIGGSKRWSLQDIKITPGTGPSTLSGNSGQPVINSLLPSGQTGTTRATTQPGSRVINP